MADPFKEIATMINEQIKKHIKVANMGLQPELGTITATGLKLDLFKYEIKDYLVADFEIQLEIPQPSRVIQTASPVNQDGSDIPNVTGYSSLTRLDFKNTDNPSNTTKVRLNLKDGLKEGDRVLVLSVNDRKDFVVIAKVI